MRSRGITLIETLVVSSIIGVTLAVLLPAVQAARNSSRRLSCSNNAHQILIGLHNFESAHGHLPTGTQLWNSKMPYRSWLSELLPLLEQTAIHQELESAYQRTRNPFDVVEHTHMKTQLPMYMCPEDGRLHSVTIAGRSGFIVGLTSYQGNLGINWQTKNGLIFGGSKIRFADVKDGLSSTYAFGERPPSTSFDYGWWYAGVGASDGTLDHTLGARETATTRFASCGDNSRQFRFDKSDDECATLHFWSLHSGGAHFGFSDGSVRFLTYQAAEILPAMSTRNGSEVVSE